MSVIKLFQTTTPPTTTPPTTTTTPSTTTPPTVFSDSHETWHTLCMYQYAKYLWKF